jgi:hypothetical protein
MSVEIVGIITLAIALIGLFRDPSFIVTAFFCATLFGSAAAFILESVGGLNISPAHFLLGFVTFKLLLDKKILQRIIRAIVPGSPGFWLLLTVLYSLISAYFMPRIFAGETSVYPVRILLGTVRLPLEPAMANLTQSIYFISDFITFVLLCGYAGSLSANKVLGNAALTCVVLNLIFVALDLVTYWTGTSAFLSFIRNATYSVMAEAELFGFKRIVGSFVEASSFAAVTVGYFAFTFRLWLLGVRPALTASLSLLSLTALLFATSATGYVGLAGYMLVCYIQTGLRASQRPITSQMLGLIVGGPFVVLLIAIAIALNADASRYVQNLLDEMLLNKMSTGSGMERSAWNQQAIQTFFDTFGFGAGLGSLRASSFPIVVLASFGIVGTTTFGLFFINLLFSRPTKQLGLTMEEATRQAAKSACIAWLITATASSALTDLGLSFYVFAALSCVQPSLIAEQTILLDQRRHFRPSKKPAALIGASFVRGFSRRFGNS